MATNHILIPGIGNNTEQPKPQINVPQPNIPNIPNTGALDTGVKPISPLVQGSKNNLITEEIFLPSGGTVYPYFSGHLTLRAMTTMEERIRLSGQDFYSTMANILNRCICNPENDTIMAEELTDFDLFAAMVKLRTISYGNEYKVQVKCPKCGTTQTVKIDLDKLAVSKVPDDFKEPFEIGPLPKTGDILGLRFLRVQDHIDIAKKVTELQQKQNFGELGDPTYTLQMERQIMTVNGDMLDSVLKNRYVESMIGMDSNYYHQKIEQIFYGVHRVQLANCSNPECNSPMLCVIGPDSEFFRPTLDD